MAIESPGPGIYELIPFETYLSWPYFHKSWVGPILKSPLQLKHEMDLELASQPSPGVDSEGEEFGEEGCKTDGGAKKETAAMALGTLVDVLLTEPETFKKKYQFLPDTYTNTRGAESVFSKKSPKCRAILDEIKSCGMTPVKTKDYQLAQNIVDCIRKHPTAMGFMSGAKQMVIVWDDPETGVRCKGRLDAYQPDVRITDLKTTDNPLPYAFAKTCNTFGYHIQAAMYHDGLFCATEKKYPESFNIPFSFVVVQSCPPHDVVCYDLGPDSLEVGREKYRKAISIYADCIKNEEWPGYSAVAETIEIPAWAANRLLLEGQYD